MNLVYKDGRTDLFFNSTTDTIDWLLKEEGDKQGVRRRGISGSYGWTLNVGRYNKQRDEWSGNACWSDMVEWARTGWKVGTDDIINMIDQVEHIQTEELGGYQRNVTGQFFDVGLVIEGEPECWFEQELEPTRKVVSICCNISSSGGLDSIKLARRGSAIIALVDQLQTAGYIVELTAVSGLAQDKKTAFAWWNFGTTPLDLDSAALVLAHPGWFRIVGHNIAQCANNDPYDNYCKEIDVSEQEKYTIYIPSSDLRTADGSKLSGAEDAAVWVHEQISHVAEIV